MQTTSLARGGTSKALGVDQQLDLAVADGWLAKRYWSGAAALCAVGLVVVATTGDGLDVAMVGLFAALSLAGWLLYQRRPTLALRMHLVAMLPLWTTYTLIGGGVPAQWIRGVGDQVLLLVFPILVLTAVDGAMGAAVGAAATLSGVLLRWPGTQERVEGLFFVATTVIMGFVFRRLVQRTIRAELEHANALHVDLVTGLLNRHGLRRVGARPAASGALLLLDVDRFRALNEVIGHESGDTILCALAQRLRATMPDGATLARTGGDEFAMVLPSGDETGAKETATAMLACFGEPFAVGAHAHGLAARVGIATWSQRLDSIDSALEHAEAAVVQAQRSGGRIFAYRDPNADTTAGRRSMDLELARAMHRREIVPYFQPIYDTATGRLVGAEALARWLHPRRGLLLPGEFVTMAEQLGLIVDLDRYMLARVAADLLALQDRGFTGWIAVNVSASSFEDPALVDRLTMLVQEHPQLRGRLVVEITESVAIASADRARRLARRFEELGLKLAIDDFGTGYSSLAQLELLEAHHLKLDRAFVSGLGKSARAEDIVELVLELARRFGIETIAEGVETVEQWAFLGKHGCPLAQGFGLARPMPFDSLLERLGAGVIFPAPARDSLIRVVASDTDAEARSGTD